MPRTWSPFHSFCSVSHTAPLHETGHRRYALYFTADCGSVASIQLSSLNSPYFSLSPLFLSLSTLFFILSSRFVYPLANSPYLVTVFSILPLSSHSNLSVFHITALTSICDFHVRNKKWGYKRHKETGVQELMQLSYVTRLIKNNPKEKLSLM